VTEAEKAIEEKKDIIGIVFNTFWGSYLCKYLYPTKKEEMKWSVKEISSPTDKKIKKILDS